jgi:hypothetical protein
LETGMGDGGDERFSLQFAIADLNAAIAKHASPGSVYPRFRLQTFF